MFSSKGNTKFSFMLDLGFKVELRVTTVMSFYILKHERGLLLGDIQYMYYSGTIKIYCIPILGRNDCAGTFVIAEA